MKKIDISTTKYPNTFAIVDDKDFEYLNQFRWYADSCGYVRKFNKKNEEYLMHRFILNAPINKSIDHINGNKLDNRKSNLRICSHQQNCWNKPPQKNALSKYKGVAKRVFTGVKTTTITWRARITYNNKTINLGDYKKEIDAAKAYNEKALELYGEYARLNIIN